MSSSSTPVYEQSIVEMKKYLDSYGVDYKDCVEKAEIVQRVKDTLANPPAKKEAPKDAGKFTVGPEIVKLLGPKLLTKSGEIATSSLEAEVVALYFSAHWCGPCRQFTPELKQLYTSSLKKSGVEVVFVSSDQDASAFKNYYGDMPWNALPYQAREIKEVLDDKYSIQGIPSLIVLDAKTGKLISKDGRRDVYEQKSNVAKTWINKASRL